MVLLRAASLRALFPFTTPISRSLPLAAPSARALCCLPPFRSTLEASDDPLPADHDTFESVKSKPDAAAADGITPEAALAELRKLRNTPNLTAADLGIHTPTPIAPFTDVDPITGQVVGRPKKGFFTKKVQAI